MVLAAGARVAPGILRMHPVAAAQAVTARANLRVMQMLQMPVEAGELLPRFLACLLCWHTRDDIHFPGWHSLPSMAFAPGWHSLPGTAFAPRDGICSLGQHSLPVTVLRSLSLVAVLAGGTRGISTALSASHSASNHHN